MIGDDTSKHSGKASGDLLPRATKAEANSKAGKSEAAKNKSGKHQKWSLKRHWRQASRKEQVKWLAAGIGLVVGVLTLGTYLAGLWQSKQHFELEHYPLVIHNRPPELLMPFTCSAKTGLHTGNMRISVKNVGNLTASSVNPLLLDIKIVPERKTGLPVYDDRPLTDCGGNPNKTPADFELPAGIEKTVNIRQTAGVFPAIKEGENVQFYFAPCVSYSDYSGNRHKTCDTYVLFVPSTKPIDALMGTAIFPCDGVERTGRFYDDLTGHCQK